MSAPFLLLPPKADQKASHWKLAPISLAAAATVMVLSACSDAASSTTNGRVMSAVKVRQLMVGSTIPSSEVVFAAAAEPPVENQGWQRLEKSAADLAETAQKLSTGARGDGIKLWVESAKKLQDSAKLAVVAAAKHDADQLSNASNLIFESCEACHKKYLPKPGA